LTTKNNKNNAFGGTRNPLRRPQRRSLLTRVGRAGARMLQPVYERNTTQLSINGSSFATGTVVLAPDPMIEATRLGGYQALHDEIRIDHITFTLRPRMGASASGVTCMYIDRDPASTIASDEMLATDQYEAVADHVSRPLVVHWRPQEPADREFNLLDPGTVSLGNLFVISNQIAGPAGTLLTSGVAYDLTTEVWFTVRGRPDA